LPLVADSATIPLSTSEVFLVSEVEMSAIDEHSPASSGTAVEASASTPLAIAAVAVIAVPIGEADVKDALESILTAVPTEPSHDTTLATAEDGQSGGTKKHLSFRGAAKAVQAAVAFSHAGHHSEAISEPVAPVSEAPASPPAVVADAANVD
jgi:hypothetical protein